MMKITVEYNDKIYNFEHGYEAYIFCAAISSVQIKYIRRIKR